MSGDELAALPRPVRDRRMPDDLSPTLTRALRREIKRAEADARNDGTARRRPCGHVHGDRTAHRCVTAEEATLNA